MFRYLVMAAACLLAGNSFVRAAESETPAQAVSTDAKPVIAMAEPLQGDFWIYEVRDAISGKIAALRTNTVTEVTPNNISVRFTVEGKETQGLNVYDRSWNLKESAPWKYQPHDGSGIRAPLKVGDSWNLSNDDINASNANIWKRTGRSKVVSQESITTKAGTFDTFKIETTMLRRPTNDPTRKMEMTGVTWYAPAIDHWVKRTYVARGNGHLLTNTVTELVEYGRKQ